MKNGYVNAICFAICGIILTSLGFYTIHQVANWENIPEGITWFCPTLLAIGSILLGVAVAFYTATKYPNK